ncbi:MAG: M48 family metalloprotease [bacterium]|nr:M48 family metalloprotease [bacterium]
MRHQVRIASRPAAISTVLLSALVLALSPAGGAALRISKPDLYEKSLKAAQQALEHYGAYDDPAERRRLNDIAYRLAVHADFDAFPFTFYLIDMPEPNAFALPGGQIFITRGMLHLGLTDDMLGCLLGHEIAHVVHEHGTRMRRRATLLNLLSQALVLGVLVGADDDRDRTYDPYDPYGRSESRKGSLVQGTAAAGMVLSELLLRNYSREFEDEADVEGQRLAAAAGFDPAGARQLWELMNARIPQSKEYGYWRTHPFSDQRRRAAEVRAEELKIQEGRPAEDYRALTQKVILDYGAKQQGEKRKAEKQKAEKLASFIERSALTAWPQGPRAEQLRLSELHRRRDAELEQPNASRDYGRLVRAYRVEIEEVRVLTPQTAFLATLERELAELRDEAEAIFPKAVEIWKEGIFQTPFLETFLSNYPTAAEVPDVALALGNAYSRIGRQTDAVEQYLRAAEVGPETPAGRQAFNGLRNLTPYLTQLAALRELADEIDDSVLGDLARKRLTEHAPIYEEIANGAEYLKRFPEGDEAATIRTRLETLAGNLYGEVVLYQGVGDHVKALEKIQLILTHAPLSRAAEMLRERAVLDS